MPPCSFRGQAVCNEIGNAGGGWGIGVGQYRNHVAWAGADFEFAIHPWGATAVAKTSRAVNDRIPESESVLTTHRCIDFPGRQHLRVLRVEQFVFLQRGRK